MKPTLTKEIAQKMYESNEQSLKDFALLNYPELGEKQLPKSWEELNYIKRGYYVGSDSTISGDGGGFTIDRQNRNTFATKEQAEASIAMAQLSQLREVYRDGWKPDWSDDSSKYSIGLFKERLDDDNYKYSCNFLSFQSVEVRDEFLENFRDLILTAKPLMS